MPIEPQIAERFPLLEGMTSFREAFEDPRLQARLDEFMAGDPSYRPPLVATQEEVVPGRHGAVSVRVYSPVRPARAHRPGLVWLHGGGFIFGDLEMPEADIVARELSFRADAIVVSVDYSLAVDGVHYPIPHDDVVDAWRWVIVNAQRLGADPARLSIGGASAGANLAAGASLKIRDDEDPERPVKLLLAYPTLHRVLPPASAELASKMTEVPTIFRFSPEERRGLTENYLGPTPTDTVYAMPAEADPAGLPPTVIITCEYDDLRSSGEAFATQLRQAGVQVELSMAVGMLHGHLNHQPTLPEVDRSLQLFAEALIST